MWCISATKNEKKKNHLHSAIENDHTCCKWQHSQEDWGYCLPGRLWQPRTSLFADTTFSLVLPCNPLCVTSFPGKTPFPPALPLSSILSPQIAHRHRPQIPWELACYVNGKGDCPKGAWPKRRDCRILVLYHDVCCSLVL